MIVDTILGFVTTILGAIFDALPTFSFVSALGLPTSTGPDTPSGTAGNYAGSFDAFFPIHETTTFVVVALTALLAGYAIYKVANWLWRHFPEIGGFGPGAG